MKSIYKYELDITDVQSLMMPAGAVPLTVQTQAAHGTVNLWALVDPEAKPELRRFRIFGTGHPVPDAEAATLVYIATFQANHGQLVFHVFIDPLGIEP